MPAMRAQVGSVVALATDRWEKTPAGFGRPIVLGQIGEITKIESRDMDFPYNVQFDGRKMPLNRNEFVVIDVQVTA